jgi:DNA-binding IclR family transcriptional regulator
VFSAAESLPLVVAIAMPAAQATDATITAVTADLRKTTEAISAELGHAHAR